FFLHPLYRVVPGIEQGRPPAAPPRSFPARGLWAKVLSLSALAPATPALGSKPDFLRERPALGSVVRGDHRIVSGKAPFRAIILRGHLIMRHQMATQHLQLLAVLEAHDVVGLHRRANGNRGNRLFLGRSFTAQSRQRGVYIIDQHRKIRDRNTIVADMRSDDIGRKGDEHFTGIGLFRHGGSSYLFIPEEWTANRSSFLRPQLF